MNSKAFFLLFFICWFGLHVVQVEVEKFFRYLISSPPRPLVGCTTQQQPDKCSTMLFRLLAAAAVHSSNELNFSSPSNAVLLALYRDFFPSYCVVVHLIDI